jgi:hypothetical protein
MHDNSPPSLSEDEEATTATTQRMGQNTPSTPTHVLREPPTSELSPPDSHGLSRQKDPELLAGLSSSGGSSSANMPTQDMLNANGKREYGNKHSSGYAWDKDEDAPGYSWMNKKAQDDMARALSQIVDLDTQIKSMFSRASCEDLRANYCR